MDEWWVLRTDGPGSTEGRENMQDKRQKKNYSWNDEMTCRRKQVFILFGTAEIGEDNVCRQNTENEY